MSNVLNFNQPQKYSQLAAEKIATELKNFKGDRYGMAVKNHVAATITHFCEQNERFAEVVYKTKRTLSDCCAEIMKGCGQSISDIDVYRGAVRNYFPNADIDFHMTITLTGEAPTAEEMERVAAQKTEPKAEKKTEEKKHTTKAEKPAQPASAAPAVQPTELSAANKPQKKTGAQTPEYRRPTPPPAPKSVEKPTKKVKGAYEDPNVIQLTLF